MQSRHPSETEQSFGTMTGQNGRMLAPIVIKKHNKRENLNILELHHYKRKPGDAASRPIEKKQADDSWDQERCNNKHYFYYSLNYIAFNLLCYII